LEQLTQPPHDRALLIAEGESDALALRAAFQVEWDVLGLPGATSWRSEWRDHVAPYDFVYVLADGDEAGRRLAWRIRHDIAHARICDMPDGEDARSLIQRQSPGCVQALLESADRDARINDLFPAATTAPDDLPDDLSPSTIGALLGDTPDEELWDVA
jgi:5S rRNA maturation endonuclease (ribonuclease M5)